MSRSRRAVLLTALLLPLLGVARGQGAAPLLPLATPGLDHLDVIVPDVEKSARFYMALFRTTLHAQPFQGGQRYFVLLGPLPENRAVGYLAIGASRGRGTYIGHFCTSVANWRRDGEAIFAQMTQQLGAAGFGVFPGGNGIGGIFSDPDGIEIQFLPSPDTLVTAAVPSDLVPAERGVVVPERVDRVQLRVTNLDRAVAYYRILYGKEQLRTADRAEFAFSNGTRLMLEQGRYVYGQSQARITRYGIRVKPFDMAAAKAAIVAAGGSIVGEERGVLRLKDADGIELELIPST